MDIKNKNRYRNNNMKRLTCLLTLLLATAGSMMAQRTVEGTVRNAADNKAIPYANIALIRTMDSTYIRGTVTDGNGHYTLTVDTCDAFLRVSSIGFESVFQQVGADDTKIDILMKEGTTTLDEVRIESKKPMYAADGDKKIYNVSEDPIIQNGTLQDALKNTPGVEVDGDGNITLNGKTVTVYINDRESHYTDDMLKQYIKTLTADQISSIEAIEFPSAKYGGGGPVINIRTQQKLMKNSYLSLGGYGSTEPEFSPFVSYAYATEKLRLNAYLRYRGSTWKSQSEGSGSMLNEESLTVRDYQYKGSYLSRSHNPSMSFNFGYDFDSMNTLSAYFGAYPSWHNNVSDGSQIRQDSIGLQMEDYSYSRHSDSKSNNLSAYGGLDFEHKFNNDGHQISFSLSGSSWPYKSSGTNWEHYVAQPQMNYDARSESYSPDGYFDFGVNYSYPYSEKGELSAGFDFSSSFDKSYYLRDTLGADGLYHCDVLRSDTSESPSNDANLYLSWRRKWGNFTLRLGGNASYENSSSRHLGLPEYDTTVNYFTITPNVLLMYNTESMHSFSLNYRMSTSHPSAGSLSHYESFSTDSYSSGNPLLEPSYSHTLGVSYSKSFEQGHSLGVNASYQWNVNEEDYLSIPVYHPFFGRYVSFSQPYNIGNSRDGNISAYARYRFSANCNVSLNGRLNDNWYRVQVRPGEWIEDAMTSWRVYLDGRAKLFNLVWVSLEGYYNSRGHGWSVLEISEPRWGMDFSASADFFDRKLSVYLNFYDIFNTANWNSTSINPYSPSTDNYTYNSQYISFGITLRFGKMDLGDSSKEGIQASSGGGKGK